MRSIFIALIVINVVVFAGQWFARAPATADYSSPVVRDPVLKGAPLQLLDEVSDRAGVDRAEVDRAGIGGTDASGAGRSSADSAPDLSVPDDPSAMCTMIGPFMQLLHAEYLVERLQSMEVRAQARSVEVPDGVDYWVYLPPEISEKEALRRLHEVQAKKIDSYLIPSGDLARGISLGMFNERIAAEQHLQAIREQGYQPEIREVARTISETWVALSLSEAEKIDPEIWVDVLRQQPGLEKRQNYCLGVAPD